MKTPGFFHRDVHKFKLNPPPKAEFRHMYVVNVYNLKSNSTLEEQQIDKANLIDVI